MLISKDALHDFLREFVREVKNNDGSTQDFDESNFAMTWRNEEGEVVCKGVEESDQKADTGLTACKITFNIAGVTLIKETTLNVLSQFLNCICSRYFWRVGFKNSSGRTWRGWNFPGFWLDNSNRERTKTIYFMKIRWITGFELPISGVSSHPNVKGAFKRNTGQILNSTATELTR